jgi:DNA modification methylase
MEETMEIRKISVDQINPAPYNPRRDLKPGDDEYKKIKKSITNFGYVDPIIWSSRTGNLVGGHQRFKILLDQGLKEVEVSVVDLPPEKEKALNLALNKIQGGWDYEKLASLLNELSQLPDFDVGISGFNASEISEIFDRTTEFKEDDFDFESALNSIDKPVTQRGDLLELGPHHLLCGDSADPKDVERLMNGLKGTLLLTDPPYNANYLSANRPGKKRRPKKFQRWEKIYNDDLPQKEYESWLEKVFSNIEVYLEPGSPIYVFNGFRQFYPMYVILTRLGFKTDCPITWAKPSFAPSYGDYSLQTEYLMYGWKKSKKGGHFWYGPNNESNLWEIKREATKELIHPTQKPVELFARALRNSSKRGDIVIDLFLGSGSTMIAAESLGRRCFGVEIDPKYCDAIVRRYLTFAGEGKASEDVSRLYHQEVPYETK